MIWYKPKIIIIIFIIRKKLVTERFNKIDLMGQPNLTTKIHNPTNAISRDGLMNRKLVASNPRRVMISRVLFCKSDVTAETSVLD